MGCKGPRTPLALSRRLWGVHSNYTNMSQLRPNVALWDEKNDNYPYEAPPEQVLAQIHLLSMKEIDQKNNEYEVTIWLRRRWNDYRLKYQAKSYGGGCFPDNQRISFSFDQLPYIWKPDIIVTNSVANPIVVADSFWVHPNGDVDWNSSLLLKLFCKFDFHAFPHDTQVCELVLGTRKEDKNEVILGFRKDLPIITKADLGDASGNTLEWTITSLGGVENEKWRKGNTTTESYLTLQFSIERKSEYYVAFVVCPVLLMVVISYASFFVDRGSAPARVAMSIISFLTITNFLATQLSALPRIGGNEIKLIKFMTLSMLFTFYAVVEYVVCNYLYRVERRVENVRKQALEKKKVEFARGKQFDRIEGNVSIDSREKRDVANVFAQNDIVVTKSDMKEVGLAKFDFMVLSQRGNMVIKDENIDIFSRLVYPIAYVIIYAILFST